MGFCIVLLVICGMMFVLDVSIMNTHYLAALSLVIFVVDEIVLINLEQSYQPKMRSLERRVDELETRD